MKKIRQQPFFLLIIVEISPALDFKDLLFPKPVLTNCNAFVFFNYFYHVAMLLRRSWISCDGIQANYRRCNLSQEFWGKAVFVVKERILLLAQGKKSDILRVISEERNWRPALRSFFMEKQISFDFFCARLLILKPVILRNFSFSSRSIVKIYIV